MLCTRSLSIDVYIKIDFFVYLYVFIVILVICLTHTAFMSFERDSTDEGFFDADSFRRVGMVSSVPHDDEPVFFDQLLEQSGMVISRDDNVKPFMPLEVFRTEADPPTLVNCIKCEKRIGVVCGCFKK